jgi:ubiquinone biosynthesis protein
VIRKIGIIGRTYRHVQRYRQIVTILFKYGFGDVLDVLKIEQYLDLGLRMISRKRHERIESLSRAKRIKMALEELGPTFVKLGQILSTRPDLLPVEFINELGKLQDDVPPFSYQSAKETIEKELGSRLEKIFLDFEETPLASASLGQVHRARLANNEDVVVKVQRPDIRTTIEIDFEIMLHLATLMEKHLEGWDIHRPTKVVQEFARTLEKELDYTIEAAHMERFASQFAGDQTIYVPKVHRELTSTLVLTMEYVDGIKGSDLSRLERERIDRQLVTRRGFNLIMEQIFVHGFFHADPHPGNVFILPNDIICYLDFGMMGRVDRQTRENFADLVMHAVKRDEARTTDALLALTWWDEEPDRHSLERDVADFIDQYFYRPLKELEIGKILQQVLNMTSRHRLRVPPDLFLMLKALSTVEALGRTLYPDFDAAREAAPFIRKIHLERIHPRRVAGDIIGSGAEFLHLLKEIPGELGEILRQAKSGRAKIIFEHLGLDPMLATHERISNRIAFAIVLASLVVGSALVVLSGIPPTWNEIPIIGLGGFLVAGLMGFWLLVSILRRGKM